MLATILLLGLVLIAAATDVARHRIYNWTTYPGMIAALGLSATGSLLAARGFVDKKQLVDLGWIPISDSLWGLLACGLLMLFCFVMFRVGGGDVKLLAMIGAFLGLVSGMEAMLWTFVLGLHGADRALVARWPVAACGSNVPAIDVVVAAGSLGAADRRRACPVAAAVVFVPCALAAVVIVRFSLLDHLMK